MYIYQIIKEETTVVQEPHAWKKRLKYSIQNKTIKMVNHLKQLVLLWGPEPEVQNSGGQIDNQFNINTTSQYFWQSCLLATRTADQKTFSAAQ